MHAILDFISDYRAWFVLAAIFSVTATIGGTVAHFAGAEAGYEACVSFIFVLTVLAMWIVVHMDFSK